jgi:hypothetical protein
LSISKNPDWAISGSALDQGSTAAAPSDSDWLMLSLLYGDAAQPGMGRAEAMLAVRAMDPGKAVPPDSANYPGIGKTDQLSYFNEVGFYYQGSSDGIVSKWSAPIKVQVSGEPTAGQKELLNGYLASIGNVAGFPGIEMVESGGTLLINYQGAAELKREYPQMTAAESCYFYISRAKGGKITKCVIGAANDFTDDAAARNQFLRMLMLAMGFEHTSNSYSDSILNFSSNAQDWAGLDWKMVELLYRADVKPGEKRAAVMKRLMAE